MRFPTFGIRKSLVLPFKLVNAKEVVEWKWRKWMIMGLFLSIWISNFMMEVEDGKFHWENKEIGFRRSLFEETENMIRRKLYKHGRLGMLKDLLLCHPRESPFRIRFQKLFCIHFYVYSFLEDSTTFILHSSPQGFNPRNSWAEKYLCELSPWNHPGFGASEIKCREREICILCPPFGFWFTLFGQSFDSGFSGWGDLRADGKDGRLIPFTSQFNSPKFCHGCLPLKWPSQFTHLFPINLSPIIAPMLFKQNLSS